MAKTIPSVRRPPAIKFPLKVSGRVLADQANTPVPLVIDTAWYTIDQFTKTETVDYLMDRKARGFNGIVMELINSSANVPGAPANAYGDTPFTTTGDLSTPREAYFAHADWVLAQCEERDIAVFLWPLYLGYQMGNEGWGQAVLANSVANCTGYGEFLGNRYKNRHNIVWVHGGDVAAGDYSAMSRVDAVANGIIAYDTVKPKLHTAHSYRTRSARDDYNRSWLTLNTVYAGHTDYLTELAAGYTEYGSSALPFVYIEGRYENMSGAIAANVRGQAWASFLAGGAGHAFGTAPVWHNGSESANNGTDWVTGMASQGSQDMARLASFLSTRPWYNLTPDTGHTVVTSGYTNGLAAASSALCLAWVPDNDRSLTIAMGGFSGTMRIRWYNPSTGAFTEEGSFSNSGSQTKTPPSTGDWVLVVEP